jgi:leucyl-tRNA---protein transferase
VKEKINTNCGIYTQFLCVCSVESVLNLILLVSFLSAGYFTVESTDDMFAQVHTPLALSSEQLDEYLFNGWFRMGQNIFTTNFLNFKGQFYSAIWLRIDLARYAADSTEQRLRKLNQRFSTSIKKASMTADKEELFSRYRESISFEASASLHQLLFGKASHNIYDTYEVAIHENSRLVACGFFDLGLKSAAGITSFYDPQYKKHSLGKFLIYLKINYCKELGLDYFYPGYFVPGYPFFDYKLSIGKNALEYLEFSSQQWLAIGDFSPLLAPIRIMQEKLNSLQIMMAQSRMESEILRYEFFEANLLPELKDVDLFDYPLFLHYPYLNNDPYITVIVYDIRDHVYHLMKCRSLWNSNIPNINGMYSSELLKLDLVTYTSESCEEMVSAIAIESKGSIDIW